jgi:hypothetical protein
LRKGSGSASKGIRVILIKKALDAKVLDNISGKRIMAELNLLLKEKILRYILPSLRP